MAQEVRELIKNRELNLYVSLDRLSHVRNQFSRLKLSANSLPIRRLPIRQAEVVCQFDLSEKYSHFLSEPVRELLHSP